MQIRTRLTILFLLLGGTIMIAASITIYYSSAGYRKVAFYNRLVDKANSITMLIPEPNRVLEIDTYNPDKLYNEKILIFNSFDNLVYTTDHNQDIKGNPEILSKIRSGEKIFYKQAQFEIIGKLYPVKSDNFIIIVAATDKDGHLYLDKLSIILVLVCLISLLLFFAAGWIFSARALKPISDVINKVDSITITSLNLRVNEGNGKDEIGRLAKTFNRMLERLEASFALQKDFIANASHELRTPLTSINGHLDVLLMKDRSPEEYKSAVKSVHDDIKALIDQSNRLLMIARTSAESPENLNKKIRIDEIIWQAREELMRFKKDYHIQISLNDSLTDCEQMVVVGDDNLLKVAVSNLMDNACKYSADHSVNVSLHHIDKHIKILFEDKGIGISEKDLEKVFEPFYRGGNALAHAAGSGIGLPLVNQIIRNYNGKIEIKSSMDSGTAVTVLLPTN